MFGKKTAVIYFSRSGVTRSLVEKFPLEEGDRTIELIPSDPYPKSYFKTLARAKVEIEGNADVGLENGKQDLGLYDRILIGFPIWFWTCPKIIKSFLAENDLRGMTIYPFCTSGGIDITEAVDEIKRNADGATVKKGMRFRKYSEEALKKWLEQ
ncbi:MAG: NAD(P)H-dependent oxidoreductase [Mogibacterium sp.]|nr:NAD(P)H-dependent oxidoreductase [Mogibacterium sp.]